MSQPETPCEKQFLALLDEFCDIMPDHEHVMGAESALDRALLYCDMETLRRMHVKLIKCLHKLGHVVDGAGKGEIRDMWTLELRDVIDAFSLFAKRLQNEQDIRIH